MTGSNQKIRALVLSALMVLSVFAGTIALSGTAAAAANASPVSAIEYDAGFGSGDGGDIEVVVSSTATVESAELFIDGESQGNETGLSVSASNRAVIPSNLNSSWPSDLKPSQDVVLRLKWSDGAGTSVADVPVTTTSQNLDTNTAPVTAFQGEPVAIVTSGTNQKFDVLKDGSIQFTRATGEDSMVYVFDTEGRSLDATWRVDASAGNYGGSLNGTVDLRNLGLEVTTDGTELTTNDNVTGTIGANSVDRPVDAELVDSSGNIVAEQKGLNIEGDGDVAYDLGSPAEGEYTVRAVDQETGNTVTTDTITVSKVTADAAFVDNVVTQERGDVAEVNVSLSGGAEEATVTFGGPDVNFEANLTVTDADGDGLVTILWNTEESAEETTGGLSVAGDDTYTIGTDGSGNITDQVSDDVEPGEYGVSVDVSPQDGSAEDLATVIVEERADTAMTTHTAPSGDGVASASSAEVGNTIAINSQREDTVILRISASGLEGSVDAASDLATGSSNDFGVWIVEDESTVGTNEDAIELDTSAMTLVTTGEEDVYYLTFSAGALTAQGAEVGDQYNVYFSSNGDTTTTELDASFELVTGQARFDTEAEQLFVQNTEDAEITGTSTWAPGSELQVNLQSGGTSPFVKSNESIVVQDDGTWSATFDLSDQATGATFEATLIASGGGEQVDGTIGTLSASVSMADQEATESGTLVTVTVNAISNGGFVAIHQESADGQIIGVSDYIAAGDTGTVEIRLRQAITGQTTLVAMAHKDTDQDRTFDFVASEGADDGPYTQADGSAVTDSATVSLDTPTPEPDTPTDTPEPDTDTPEPDTDTPEPDTDTPEPDTPTPTPTTSPGFGLIVALLALAGAALLARRRE